MQPSTPTYKINQLFKSDGNATILKKLLKKVICIPDLHSMSKGPS